MPRKMSKEYNQAWYQAHKDVDNARSKQWSMDHPGYSNQRQQLNPNAHRERSWRRVGIVGLTYERYIATLEAQNYQCAVCKRDLDTHSPADHDHVTGQFRGVLCHNCNRAIGLLGDNKDTTCSLAQYMNSEC